MLKSEYYELNLPELADQYDVEHWNENTRKIDKLIHTAETNIESLGDSKQDNITGAGSTITKNNLEADKALVSDSSGKVAVSDVTAAELGYLGGSVSNIQAQINHAMMNLFAIRALTTEEIDEVMA